MENTPDSFEVFHDPVRDDEARGLRDLEPGTRQVGEGLRDDDGAVGLAPLDSTEQLWETEGVDAYAHHHSRKGRCACPDGPDGSSRPPQWS